MSAEEGTSLRVLGYVLLVDDQTKAALDAFERSLALLVDRDPYEAARTRHQWGLALCGCGDVARGTSLLQQALTTFRQLGAKHDLSAVEIACKIRI